nr:CRACD-like protein [Aegilops tauschii subsp. strangulata]
MPDFNAHALDPSWAEPPAEKVQEFFDILPKAYVHDEPLLVQDTTKEEQDYIAVRATEVALAREAGSADHEEDEAEAVVEEKELAGWAESAGEASSAGIGAPLTEDVVDESTEKEVEADDPPAMGKRRVLWRSSSGEPVRPGKTARRQGTQEESVRLTRAAAAKNVVKAAVAKKKATASSSSRRCQTPSPSPLPADIDTEVVFDLRDRETSAQRVAKRAKASMGDKPPAGTPNTPMLVDSSPETSPWRSPHFSPQHPSSADREDIDTIIEEVSRDAKAEANKIAAKDAAKTAAEDAAKGPALEASKAAAEEAGKGPAQEANKAAAEEGMVDDQPSSSAASGSGKYLKVGDDLFVHLPGTARTRAPTKGEVFDDEVKELEVEWDGLKEQALNLAKEKDTLNGALVETSASVSGLLCSSVRLGDHCFHSLPARSPPAAPERYPGPGFLLLRASAADRPRPSPPPHARVLRSSATDSPAAPMTGCVARLARRLVLPFSSGRAARRRLRRLRRVRLRPAAVTPPPSPRDRQPAPRLRGRLPCVPGRRGPSALPHGRLPRWPAPPATRLRLPRPAPVLAGSACHPASPESPRLRLASRPRLLRLWARPARGVHRIDVRFIRLHSRQLRLGRGREAPASSSPARGRVAPAGSAPARGRLRLAPPASPPRLARLRPLPGRLRPRPCASPPSGRARRSTIVPDQLFRPRLQPSPPPPLPRRVPAAAFCRDSPAGCCRAPASCDGQLHPATRPAGSARTGFTGDPACRLRGGRLLSPLALRMRDRVVLLIVSGATATTGGWELGREAVIYPGQIARLGLEILTACTILRMYHSATRHVLVGGSNLLNGYRFANVMYST